MSSDDKKPYWKASAHEIQGWAVIGRVQVVATFREKRARYSGKCGQKNDDTGVGDTQGRCNTAWDGPGIAKKTAARSAVEEVVLLGVDVPDVEAGLVSLLFHEPILMSSNFGGSDSSPVAWLLTSSEMLPPLCGLPGAGRQGELELATIGPMGSC